MNAQKTKFNFSKKNALKKFKANPEYYSNRDNAINTYNLVLKNYGVIKFRTGSDKVKLDYQIDELRKITWIKDKVYFSI